MNIQFTAFDKATGEVQFSGTASDPSTIETDMIGVLVGAVYNGGWLEGEVHYDVPAQPDPAQVWDWGTKTWYDPRTLQDRKDAKWEAIKAARASLIDAPLSTPFGVFDSDASARTSITDAVLMLKSMEDMGQAGTIDFTLANNSVIALTTAQMVEVGLLLGQKVQLAYTTSRVRRVQIEAATTPAEVEAVAW